ncbi:potassium channel family protein [Pseudonocardia kunmingensis]|uniref:potassium channel family protein n=1 Tax=Pseudonocardia kunmingensis TaxID=630975 RepID=UPI001B88269B|nr:potassium channel family protein [Pseudonocardia kunmingensis]
MRNTTVDWVISLVGLGVVVAAVRDVFRTLWFPSGRGTLSRATTRLVWNLCNRRRRRARPLAGPLAMAAVVGAWTALVVLGWALVYGPHLPEGFAYSTGLEPGRRGGPLDAVYLSLVTTATLGFGDIVPRADWLRLATPLQAVVGFGLLTAAVSWVLQIYPALNRRRAFALRLAMLDRADAAHSIPRLEAATAGALLADLASEITRIRVDLTEYAITYYFPEVDRSSALAVTLVHALRLARAGASSDRADVRLAATVLTCALDDIARVLDRAFLHVGGTVDDVLAAFAADHGHANDGR